MQAAVAALSQTTQQPTTRPVDLRRPHSTARSKPVPCRRLTIRPSIASRLSAGTSFGVRYPDGTPQLSELPNCRTAEPHEVKRSVLPELAPGEHCNLESVVVPVASEAALPPTAT